MSQTAGVLCVLLGVVFLVALAAEGRRRRSGWLRMLRLLVDRHGGLRYERARRGSGLIAQNLGHHVVGELDGRAVVVERQQARRGGRIQTCLRVSLSAGVPSGFRLLQGGKLSISRPIVTGHSTFDDGFRCTGPPVESLAVLNDPARSALMALSTAGELAIREGELSLTLDESVSDVDYLEVWLHRLTATAAHLGRPGRVPERLAANARETKLPGVRLANLRALYEAYPADESARSVATLAYETEDQHVRIGAAAYVGNEGTAWLRALVEDVGSDEVVRRRALESLERGDESLTLWLERLVERGNDPLLGDFLERLVGGGSLLDASVLLRRLPTADTRARRAMAKLLKFAREDADAQRLLLELLDDGDEGVKLASLEALANVAGLSAVEHLLPLTEGLFRDRDIDRAARHAIDRIQSRGGRRTNGGLSLAEAPERGGLALSEEGGALAVAVVATDDAAESD